MLRLMLLLLLAAWPSVGAAKWREASSRHFVIYSEQNEEELRKTADELERFDRALRVQLGRRDDDRSPATRLTIYVLPNQQSLEYFADVRYAAGVYFGRASGSVAFTHRERPHRAGEGIDPRVVLFHEYTHHFLYNNFAFGAPMWFSEGYPEFWSTTNIAPDGAVSFGIPGTHRSTELTLLPRINAQRLLTLRLPIRDGATYATIYGRGWVLAHYLSFEPARAGQLNAYLRALHAGRSPDVAATVFGDLDQLDSDIERYMRRRVFSYATFPAEMMAPGPIQIRDLGEGEGAIMSVRMRTRRGVDERQVQRQAQALVPDARRVAGRFPSDPSVQVVLAEVEYEAGNFDEAEAAADRAIAAAPGMVEAHLFRARALSGRLEAANDRRPERWQEVQRRIGAANRLDPDDPEPLIAFFESFAAAGWQPTPSAIEGLLLAQAAAPEDRTLRITAARTLLSNGNAPMAKAMLSPLASDSHSGILGPRIGEILSVLDTGNTAAALQQLEAALAEQAAERRGRRTAIPANLRQQCSAPPSDQAC